MTLWITVVHQGDLDDSTTAESCYICLEQWFKP